MNIAQARDLAAHGVSIDHLADEISKMNTRLMAQEKQVALLVAALADHEKQRAIEMSGKVLGATA